MLQVRNLSKIRKNSAVLRNVTLSVVPGKVLALVSSLYSYSEGGDMKLYSGHLADDLTLILLQKE